MKSTKTKMINRFIISIAGIIIACCCISCKETVREELQILIQNETDSIVHVKLFPIKTAPETVTLYPVSDIGGGFANTEFDLPALNDRFYNNDRILFYTSDLNIEAYTLAAKVFDSIHISTRNKDIAIVFTHEKVIGYSENIFSKNSTWEVIIVEQNEQTQFRKNPVKSYCYRFLILKDKMITN